MEKREAGSVLGSRDVRSEAGQAYRLGDRLRVADAPHVCRVEAYGAKVVAISSGFGQPRPIPSITSVGAALAAVAHGGIDCLSSIDPLRHSQFTTPVDTPALWCDAGSAPVLVQSCLPRVSGNEPLVISRGGHLVFAIAVWLGSTGHGLGTSPVVAAIDMHGSVSDACVAASIIPIDPPSTRIAAHIDCTVIRGQSDLLRESIEATVVPDAYLPAAIPACVTRPVLLIPVTEPLSPSIEFATDDIVIASIDPSSTAACRIRRKPEQTPKDNDERLD